MFVLSTSPSVNEDNLMSTIRKCLFYLFCYNCIPDAEDAVRHLDGT
jgi:hypothetical protein